MDMEKPIAIQGKHNRYWIKKTINTFAKPNPVKLLSLPTMERKRQSYLAQDKKNKTHDASTFVSLAEVNHLLEQSGGICFYCQKRVMTVYEHVKEQQQWTLDRIDNQLGHCRENVVIACLQCNLKRRRKPMEAFLFTQQLQIEKVQIEKVQIEKVD